MDKLITKQFIIMFLYNIKILNIIIKSIIIEKRYGK